MSRNGSGRILLLFIMILAVVSIGASVFAETTSSFISEIPSTQTAKDPVTDDPGTAVTTTTPATSSNRPVQTTEPTAQTTPESSPNGEEDGGFNYTGLIIAVIIAAAVILLVILLIPKNKNKK